MRLLTMQLLTVTALLALLPFTFSSPAPNNPPPAAPAAAPLPAPIYPRQNGGSGGIADLLRLASLAGIALPTDPALLLSLGPLAAQLGSLLPTAPVLSALETAAPSGFVSHIVHDPAYASSFEEAFAAGSSPSWFLALPSDVRSYLHTYRDFTGVAGALATDVSVVASLQSGAASASASVSSAMASRSGSTGSGSDTATGTGSTQTLGSVSATGSASSGSTTRPTSTSTAGAARETGVLAAGAIAMAGILGVAVAL